MNGAVHGEATITANTPVKNDPETLSDPIPPSLVSELPMLISVNSIMPIMNINILNIPTIIGD
jgi:hypothetical protein